jgi:hypothetical protein
MILHQQQELLKPVLGSIAPPVNEEQTMTFGCRSCDTLRRRVEELEQENNRLQAKIDQRDLPLSSSDSDSAILDSQSEDDVTSPIRILALSGRSIQRR